MESNNNTPAMGKGSHEQSVTNSAAQSNSSRISLANAQVEAAIAHIQKANEGMEIRPEDFHQLQAQIKNIISLTFAGQADIGPESLLPVYVQLPDLITDCLADSEDIKNLLKTIQTMQDAAENDTQFIADIYTFDQVAQAFEWIVDAGRSALVSRAIGTGIAPTIQPTRSLTATKPNLGHFYDAVKHANNGPITISSDCVFFNMLTLPENVASFIENIPAWFAIWSNEDEKWAGNLRTSAGDYSVLMEFLGRMVVAVAEHDAEEIERESNLKSETEALTTENKWLAQTLDKTLSNNKVLQAGIERIEEIQSEVDRLRSKYEPGTDSKKGGSAK